MHFNHRTFFTVTLILLISYVIIKYFSFQNTLNNYLQSRYQESSQNLQILIDNKKQIVQAMALNFANSETVQRAYREDNSSRLKREYSKSFSKLQHQFTLKNLLFFKSSSELFAKFPLSTLKKGSNLDEDINWIIQNGNGSATIIDDAIRVIQPVVDNKTHTILGVVVVEMELKAILNIFTQTFKEDIFIVNNNTITSIDGKEIKSLKIQDINQSKYIWDGNYGFYLLNYGNLHNNSKYKIIAVENLEDIYSGFYKTLLQESLINLLILTLIYIVLRRETDKTFRKIEKLSQLSIKLHNREFSYLNHFDLTETGEIQIDILSNNIVDMGIALDNFYQGLKEDINEKNQKLKRSFYIDNLTSIYNRRALEEDCGNIICSNKNVLKQDTETRECKVLILLDIDKFSTINDFFGLTIGDYTLKKVAIKLEQIANRYNAKAYRIGSDIFAFAMFDEEDEKIIKYLINKLNNFTVIYEPDEVEINLDFTFGISRESRGGVSIANSEIALHEAKSRKVREFVFSQDFVIKEKYAHNIALSNKIRDGIKNDRFVTFYQPIYNKNREIVKYEALVRLKDGDRYLTPYHFLEYAQKTKYYFEITKIVIDKSFKRFEENSLEFSVNLSARDIVNRDMAQYIEEKVKKFHTPSNITFEILESEHIEELETVLDFIKRVRAYGVKIAIDDFGSGYSNFSYLLDIKPDYLKIDGSIIKDIATKRGNYLIAKTITEFAKVSHFTVIGEFIDSEEVLQKAMSIGVDMFQGYYLSQPLKEI